MEIYGKLDERQKACCMKIQEVLKRKGEKVIAPTGMEKKQFFDSVEAVEYNFPELFYVDFRTISYTEYSDHYEYNPQYLYTFSEIVKLNEQITRKADEIIKKLNISDKVSVYDKCGRLHNYMVSSCTYDYDAKDNSDKIWSAYTIEGFFLKKKAVCQGIAFAFKFLCDKAGVDTIVARGVSLQPGCTTYERHAWNIVRAGGEAAHIDITWDMCLKGDNGKIRYDYFFLPDLEMMRDHQYVGYPICRQLRSSYFEKMGTQFSDVDMLGEYIESNIVKYENDIDYDSGLYLHFKMKNRKENKSEIQEFVNQTIRKATKKGYSYTVSVNEAQYVFCYNIDIAK